MRETLFLFLLLFSYSFLLAQSSNLVLPNSEVNIYNAYRINSNEYEFSPTYYQDGIVYIAAQKGDAKNALPFFELYYAPLAEDGMPSNHRPFSNPLNSLQHEGQASFPADSKLIYYTGNSQTKNKQGRYTMKIYEARKEGDTWKHIVDLPFNSETYSNRHPAISKDAQTLYFASDMPGGFGGSDIYVVKKEGTYWGVPKNLGTQVNTAENDAFPFIYQDQYLFFSSKGHTGNGDYDIYAIDIEDDLLGSLIHLDTTFNSASADFGFILDDSGKSGFFSSDRVGGFGKDDIYLFEISQDFFATPNDIQEAPEFTLTTVTEEVIPQKAMVDTIQPPAATPIETVVSEEKKPSAQRNTPVPSEFPIADVAQQEILTAKSVPCTTINGTLSTASGKPLANAAITVRSSCGGLPFTLTTNDLGAFESCLPTHCQYIIAGEKAGFQQNDVMVEIKSANAISTNLTLTPINHTPNFPTAQLTDDLTVGSIIEIRSLAYDLEKGILLSTENYDLNKLITLLQNHPSLSIEVVEHTDARGSAYYNYELSQARAGIIKNHLVQQGRIAPKRIKAIGMGEQQLSNHCNGSVPCSDEEHQQNRRTEIRITKLNGRIAAWNG